MSDDEFVDYAFYGTAVEELEEGEYLPIYMNM